MSGEECWNDFESFVEKSGLSEEVFEDLVRQSGRPGRIVNGGKTGVRKGYAALNASLDPGVDGEKVLIYGHSPGFEPGESGYMKVNGRVPLEEVSDRIPGKSSLRVDNNVSTGYLPYEVRPEAGMPVNSSRSDGVPEAVLQYEENMRAGEHIVFETYPWQEPEEDVEEVLQRYDGRDIGLTGERGS
ncbi:MAG: hypothetical protein ABEJ95_05850 [Candidatus Nanohalobium sp.]